MQRHSRREFMKKSAGLAAGTAALKSLGLQALSPVRQPGGSTQLAQLNYDQVQLLEGPMQQQFKHNHALFLNLSDDSLLKPFRQLAGLPAPGEDMGGWYSPSSKFDPPKDMTGYIPGHSFGQYLSGLSRAYAVTKDPATRQKVQRLVNGFAPTVTPAFYRDYCIPAYTFDKTNCGLIDAHQFAGTPTALSVLDHATDAVLPWLPPKALNREQMMARPHRTIAYTWDETYTLPENFYLAYQRGAGTRYRQLARRFLQDDTYFEPLAEGRNVLPGQHAYSHVNALSSAMQSYLVDESDMHFKAARNGFDFVLEQSFATGGWGPDETFRDPTSNELFDSLQGTHNGFETPCGAYGHFKIARYLMRVTGESRYGDSMEAVLYNTILGARPIQPDGVSFYYADYNHDAHKVDYDQKWPCCSGTFPQLTADYGISSYLGSPKGIYVNLFVPSSVTWRQGGTKVQLIQKTTYPATNTTSLEVRLERRERFTVALRIPNWAGGDTSIYINGRKEPMDLKAGQWATCDRTWRNGDRLELVLDMPIRLSPIDSHHPDTIAMLYGPVALFATMQAELPRFTRQQLLAARKAGNGSDEWHVSSDSGVVVFRSYAGITDERYRLYHQV